MRCAGRRRDQWLRMLALGALLLAIAACAAPPPLAVRQEMEVGDRQQAWGVVYFASWSKDHNRHYLQLARERTQEAVLLYLALERRIGYSYPDFYVIDRRRVAGCDLLDQINSEAESFQLHAFDRSRPGCFR